MPVPLPTATNQESTAAAEQMSDAPDAKSTALDENMSDDAADANGATPEETGNAPEAPEVEVIAIDADTAQKSQTKVSMVMTSQS